MRRHFLPPPATKVLWPSSLGLVLLCLATLVGCQGFSTGKSSSQSPSGILSLSGASLDFGSVTAGTSKKLTVTASNTGTASITVSSVSISSKYFALSGTNLPIAIFAGQSSPISVVFTPNAAGAFSATVSISSNASDSATTLTLTGTGVSSGQLAVSPASESFGSVTVGSQSNQTVTLTNNSGSTVNITQASVSGSAFKLSGITTPLALSASKSTTFTATFAPQTTGNLSGTVTITSDAPNPTLSLPLSGTGLALGALGANPTSLDFGSVQVSSKQALSETVTNTGGSTVTISQVGISGTGFTLSGISTPTTLTAGQSATFSVTFAPLSAGGASGSVTVTSNGSNPTLTIPLAGIGSASAGQLTATPAPIAIGSVVAGTSGTATGSLNASGANVKVTAATTSNSRFAISGLSLPVTIPAGKSASFTVTFSPLVAGADSATLTFTSNAVPSTTTDTATGTATLAPTHSVSLSWTASTSSNISGYNVYRAVYVTSCGGYSKINGATLDTLTTYTDSTVIDGTNYCYATTAVNSSQEESGYSNIVSDVQIPPP
jgi:Protein of unknown function (DUF1573)/Abnormal spindle-like microcephaly-assoc'd, ASPM-SPD-2-Hydin